MKANDPSKTFYRQLLSAIQYSEKLPSAPTATTLLRKQLSNYDQTINMLSAANKSENPLLDNEKKERDLLVKLLPTPLSEQLIMARIGSAVENVKDLGNTGKIVGQVLKEVHFEEWETDKKTIADIVKAMIEEKKKSTN